MQESQPWWGWSEGESGEEMIAQQDDWRSLIIERPWSMLEVIGIASQRQAEFSPKIVEGFREIVADLGDLSVTSWSHWWSGLAQLFSSPHIVASLRLMRKTGLLSFLLPLPSASVGWDLDQSSNTYHHETVWEHTLSVMRHLQTLLEHADLPLSQRLRLSLVAFFHDMGKTVPMDGHQHKEDGGIRFVGHPKVSAKITHEVLLRLGAAAELRHDVERLVLCHDEILDIRAKDLSADPPSPKILGLVLRMERRKDLMHDLAFFAIADRLAHAPGHDDDSLMRSFLEKIKSDFDLWQKKLAPLLSQDEIDSALSDGDGASEILLRRHLLWCQRFSFLQEHTEALSHLQRLQHVARSAGTSLADTPWLEVLLAPMEKAWPSLEQPIEFWIIDHLHRLRFPHEDPKQAELLFPDLFQGRDLLEIAKKIAKERSLEAPRPGPWVGVLLREIAFGQLRDQQDLVQTQEVAKKLLIAKWDELEELSR
ncbi:MAG: HD domain-containing protein [Myxococcales bacterium]|nr:HD domain-containing protein [Myxococcales bacterium]